jgi:hypothetical protein
MTVSRRINSAARLETTRAGGHCASLGLSPSTSGLFAFRASAGNAGGACRETLPFWSAVPELASSARLFLRGIAGLVLALFSFRAGSLKVSAAGHLFRRDGRRAALSDFLAGGIDLRIKGAVSTRIFRVALPHGAPAIPGFCRPFFWRDASAAGSLGATAAAERLAAAGPSFGPFVFE